MDEFTTCTCPHCGEPITVTLDPSAGTEQEYVEDCPVCCHPHLVHVHFDRHANAEVTLERE